MNSCKVLQRLLTYNRVIDQCDNRGFQLNQLKKILFLYVVFVRYRGRSCVECREFFMALINSRATRGEPSQATALGLLREDLPERGFVGCWS